MKIAGRELGTLLSFKIAGIDVGALLKKTVKETLDDNLLTFASATAYTFFFSIFPLLLFLAPLAAAFGRKQQVYNFVMEQFARSLPPDYYKFIHDVFNAVVFSPDAPGLVSVSAALTLWSASSIFGALIGALNQAYDVRETRAWWKTKLISIVSVFVVGITFALSSVVVVAGDSIVGWLAPRVGLGVIEQRIVNAVQALLVFGMLLGLSFLTFYFLPNVRHHRKRMLLAGSTVTTVLWIAVTLGFRAYVQHFGSYNKTYGTIGAVIVMLTWMYLSILVFLVGGELNSELQCATRTVAPGQEPEDEKKAAVPDGKVAQSMPRALKPEMVK